MTYPLPHPDPATATLVGPPPVMMARQLDGGRNFGNTARIRAMDPDEDLLRLIALNNEAAFRQLVERHVDRAYALALRILRNASDAEDVVQDTLLKIWTHRGTWESGRAKFSTWLYRVVTNRCLDLRRRPQAEGMDVLPEITDGKPDALTSLHRHEVSDLLTRELERLPDQQRVALILSYFDDLSNAEIAEVMDTTVSAVEALLKRGRQHLRKQLKAAERDIRQSFTDD